MAKRRKLEAPSAEDLSRIEAELAAVNEVRDRPTGKIRISASDHAINELLLPKLSDFMRDHPDVKVEMITDYGLIDIISERYDAGVRYGETLAKDMIAVRIGPDARMVAVGSPAYFQRYGNRSEELAMIAAKNHANGAVNPYAHMRKDIGFEACNAVTDRNPYVAAPLGRTDCSLVSDGAAALVGVTSVDSVASANRRWRVSANGSCILPQSEDAMTWQIGDHGFVMTLSSRVPDLIQTDAIIRT